MEKRSTGASGNGATGVGGNELKAQIFRGWVSSFRYFCHLRPARSLSMNDEQWQQPSAMLYERGSCD